MKREVSITKAPIDEGLLLRQRAMSPGMGAGVYFIGVVRDVEDGRTITGIEYEAFEEMARRQFDLILDQVEKRWPIESVRLVHRIGPVKVNEASLWVEVLAPHRGEAFCACEFLIEEMKELVPIWKKPMLTTD